MHSPDSKADYYFRVVGKHYPSLIWQETGNYSPVHHSTLCKVQSADCQLSRLPALICIILLFSQAEASSLYQTLFLLGSER